MGRIKWDSLAVAQSMDATEDILLSARPLIDEAIAFIEVAQALPNLPDYIKYALSSLHSTIDVCLTQCIYRIHTTKGQIPDTAPTTPKRELIYSHSMQPNAVDLQEAEEKEIDRMLDIDRPAPLQASLF